MAMIAVLLIGQLYQSPPIRQVTNQNYPPALIDVESQMPANHIYRDKDIVTWTHETTHGINSRLRNTYKQKCFYVLDNQFAMFREPKITKRHVAQFLTFEYHDYQYNTYFNEPYWQDEPTHLLDEWVAYANGSVVRNQANYRQRDDTIKTLVKFDAYATALLLAVEKYDPNYPDLEKLRWFITWHLARSHQIVQDSGVTPLREQQLFKRYFILTTQQQDDASR